MTRIVAAVLVVFSPVCAAAAPSRDVTVDDYFSLASVSQVALSPNGKHLAYAEARWQNAGNDRKTDLWLIELRSGEVKQLTRDRANDRSLKWAADGATLYFLGNRKHEGEKKPPYDGKTQIWKLSLEGGEPADVTRSAEGVDAYDLSADGKTLYYTSETTLKEEDPFASLRERHDNLEYGHGSHKASRLWKLDLKTGQIEKILEDRRYIREFAVAPDGKRAALITTPDDRIVSFEGASRVDILDLETLKLAPLSDQLWRADAPSPYAWLEGLAWAPDGRRLAFNVVFDAYPAEIIVAEWRDGKPTTSRVERGKASVRGYGSPLQWRTATQLCLLAEVRAQVQVQEASARLELGAVWTPRNTVVSAFSFAADGETLAYVASDPQHLPEIHLRRGDEVRRLTDLNSQAKNWKLPRVSIVAWKGANDTQVEGVLELPADYEKGKPLPLVVGLHGGPTTAIYAALDFSPYEGRMILPARGYALLLPNYRGSTGYGDRFITDLIGKENSVELEDILNGVDALIDSGVADRTRLGVMGWSNGGYLTNCLIARTPRFKAASSGAGILDTVTEWGINDEPAYAAALKGGHPWQKPDVYRRSSPIYDIGKVLTPTLIHVGAADERCPPGQSRMLYRALHEYVKAPTELVVYPGEPHSLGKLSSRKAKMEWDLAWFDHYLLNKGKR
jgi:dipeptidyl aminopeptidase/acylaminoacyl peptidase